MKTENLIEVNEKTALIPIPIVAALISAAATAASAALSTTAQVIGHRGSSCATVNNTPFAMTRVDSIWQPAHGELQVHPNSQVLSLLDGATADSSGKPGSKWQENNNTTWGLSSRGSGTELLTCFRMDLGGHAIVLSLYAGNPVTGAPYAGVSVADESWFNGNSNKHKKDSSGHWLIEHIKHVHGPNCSYSKNGQPRTAGTTDGLIQVDFASAVETTFRIRFTGDWKKFRLPG